MSILKTDFETLSRHLADAVQKQLESAIKAELMVHADAVVSEVARDMAANLRSSITSYNDFPNDKVNVTLVLDRVKAAVPD